MHYKINNINNKRSLILKTGFEFMFKVLERNSSKVLYQTTYKFSRSQRRSSANNHQVNFNWFKCYIKTFITNVNRTVQRLAGRKGHKGCHDDQVTPQQSTTCDGYVEVITEPLY